MDPNDTNNIQRWKVKRGRQVLKEPYWEKVSPTSCSNIYTYCKIKMCKMAAEEQEIDWIYFELNDGKYRIERENSNNLQRWKVCHGRHTLKEPFWCLVPLSKNQNGYLKFKIANKPYLHHRVVYYAHNSEWDFHDSSKNNSIDHIDHNRSNNHISNLRIVNHYQNMQNRNVKGCWYNKINNKWMAAITINYNQINLGSYDTEEEAHDIYLKVKSALHPFYNHIES